MKQTVYLHDFRDAFRRADRSNFSYEGQVVLFDYITEYEESTGEEMELDVIALCCEFTEDTPKEIADNYGIDISDIDEDDDQAIEETVLEYLYENTSVAGPTSCGTIVYQNF